MPDCKMCDRIFSTERGVKLHMTKTHSATPISWNFCNQCDYPIIDDPRSPGDKYCSESCSKEAFSEERSCKKVDIECKRCGNIRRVYPYRAEKEFPDGFMQNCKKCMERKVDVECSTCSKDVTIQRYRLDTADNHFCSEKCENKWRSKNYKKEKHPRWTGGYPDIPFGVNWENNREECISRDTGCFVCGMTREESVEKYERDLEVHHIIPRKTFYRSKELNINQANALENLMTLCIEHHRKAEKYQPVKENCING